MAKAIYNPAQKFVFVQAGMIAVSVRDIGDTDTTSWKWRANKFLRDHHFYRRGEWQLDGDIYRCDVAYVAPLDDDARRIDSDSRVILLKRNESGAG